MSFLAALGLLGAGVAGQSWLNSSAASQNAAISKSLMRYQSKVNKDYASWSAQQLPSLNRAGMESAGFNPLLALSSGTGEQGHVSPTQGSMSAPDLMASAKGIMDLKQGEAALKQADEVLTQTKEQTKVLESQKDLNKAKTDETNAKAEQLRRDSGVSLGPDWLNFKSNFDRTDLVNAAKSVGSWFKDWVTPRPLQPRSSSGKSMTERHGGGSADWRVGPTRENARKATQRIHVVGKKHYNTDTHKYEYR